MCSRGRPELHGLVGERKGAGDYGLTGDHSGGCGKPDHGEERPVRVEQIERVLDRLRARQQQRSLAEIIQGERR